MHAFGKTENVLLDAVEVPKTAIIGELNAQDAATARIVSEAQDCIDDLEEETSQHRETITATHPEQAQRVAAVREAGLARRKEMREETEGARYELAVVHSPILLLPYELMAEIFDWHMLMGGRLAARLLVCKQWTMVAYTSPRLWARITITNLPFRSPYLRGSVVCTHHDYLRLVLSRSRSHPLQLELSFRFDMLTPGSCRSSSSFIHGPQATNNCSMAIKHVLSDQILRRCTTLVLVNEFLPFDHLNTTVLPLLSSIQILAGIIKGRELHFIQSLVNLSPSLRHIRCNSSLSAKNQGVGLWTKRIEFYVRISPYGSYYLLHESPSLRCLEIYRDLVTPLTLPALEILRWTIASYSSFHDITAPRLHTLILRHGARATRTEGQTAGSISFPNLRVAIHTWVRNPTDLDMFHTPALEHLSIEYRSLYSSPTRLIGLFDSWAHMPKPRSLHLDCTFTETALIVVLGRLPWLEELRIAGTGVRETFWEGLTPSYNLIQHQQVSSLPNSYSNEINATHILVPNLKVLLVNYPTGMRHVALANSLQTGMAATQVHNHQPDVDIDISTGEDCTVKRALTVAAAREQAGYPLRTLACWSWTREVKVLIGSLDSLSKRPRFVLLTAFWC